ncbi:F-box/kelch-repeat protein At3g06240-like [Papaver somniferum]|uniref:F-box/kelch-repeat protein At3g06240-like n=1 Tax=Papaver somniferum TaxID=3469 RepID=UPI000E6F5A37|nr:F-box/kelch-repeat protein At3g06240-like [Papaver somniferum]
MLPETNRVGMDAETSGFGYVSSTNEYKVVRVMFSNDTEFVEVYIYTLGSGNGWRNVGKFNFGAYLEEGIFVDGVLYWLDYESETIAPFDLAEEKFFEPLSFPVPPEDNASADYKLRGLDGCLVCAMNLPVNGADCWNTWILKKKVDNQPLGWSKHIKNQELEASTSKIFVDLEERFIRVFPHKNTFVSLKELGEEDTKMMESVEIEETESLAQPFNQLTLDSYL